MKPKHTKGPWVIHTYARTDKPQGKGYGSNYHYTVASQDGDPIYSSKNQANINLIAAAPEMLEALEFLFANISTDEMQRLEDRRDANFVRLEALIAKARGVK